MDFIRENKKKCIIIACIIILLIIIIIITNKNNTTEETTEVQDEEIFIDESLEYDENYEEELDETQLTKYPDINYGVE